MKNKNIHILPTDKLSRLAILHDNKLHIGTSFKKDFNVKPQHIYITYKDEIKALHQKNEKLLHSNDSLKVVNKKIDKELEKIYGIIKITEKLIVQYDNRINNLKNKQDEISNRVNILSADGVAIEFTNYIKKRSGKSVRK